MLFEILRRNLIPCGVGDGGCHILSTRGCSNTISRLFLRPPVHGQTLLPWGPSHLVGSRTLGPNPLFLPQIPSRRPGRKFVRVSKTQSSLRIPAPRQESPRGESTKVVVAANNGCDESILKLRDDRRKHLRGGIGISFEHHGGRVGEGVALRRHLKIERSHTRHRGSTEVMRLTWVMSMVSADNSTCGCLSLPSLPVVVWKA